MKRERNIRRVVDWFDGVDLIYRGPAAVWDRDVSPHVERRGEFASFAEWASVIAERFSGAGFEFNIYRSR
jgi:hypothetical protein